MLSWMLLGISVVLGTTKNALSKAGGAAFKGTKRLQLVNLLTACLASVVYALLGGFSFALPLDGFVLACAAAYALGTIGSQFFLIKAMEHGSVALSSLLYAYGFLLPTLFGTLFYRETVGVAQAIGCVLIAGALFLCLGGKGGGKISPRWLLFAGLALLSSGGVGVVQKIFRSSVYAPLLDNFLLLSFLMMAVLSLALYLLAPKNAPEVPPVTPLRFLLPALLLGAVVCAANKLNLYLSGVFSSIIMFPCVNGGCILLSLLVSRALFHEKISARQVAGILVGVAAIALMGIK